jgi:hypothetical protein
LAVGGALMDGAAMAADATSMRRNSNERCMMASVRLRTDLFDDDMPVVIK